MNELPDPWLQDIIRAAVGDVLWHVSTALRGYPEVAGAFSSLSSSVASGAYNSFQGLHLALLGARQHVESMGGAVQNTLPFLVATKLCDALGICVTMHQVRISRSPARGSSGCFFFGSGSLGSPPAGLAAIKHPRPGPALPRA